MGHGNGESARSAKRDDTLIDGKNLCNRRQGSYWEGEGQTTIRDAAPVVEEAPRCRLLPMDIVEWLEDVLQGELCDTRPGPVLTRDGPEGGAAGDGVGCAWVIQDGVVQHIEVFGPELQTGSLVHVERARERRIPYRKSRTAKGILDHISKSGSCARVGRNGKCRRVQPTLAEFTYGTIAAPLLALEVSGLREVPLGAILAQAGR